MYSRRRGDAESARDRSPPRATSIQRMSPASRRPSTVCRTKKGKLPAPVGQLAEVLARGASRPPTPALPRKGGGRNAQPSPEGEARSSRVRPLSPRGEGETPSPPPVRGRVGWGVSGAER